MAKLPFIELSNGLKIPILHEDRNVIAIDKPQGWMLAPVSWQNTGRNLFAALTSSVKAGDFWARSRNLKFIRFVHRLDADTSGVLLLVKAPGAVPAFTELFEDRKVRKVYLAVVKGVPEVTEWKCRLRLAPMQDRAGLMEINNAIGKDSETLFRVIDKRADRALLMCWPLTGRTHQIRLHLAAVGHPVWGDELYGKVPTTNEEKTELKLALRSIGLGYKDPFMAEPVEITADAGAFVKLHGFEPANQALTRTSAPEKVLEHPKARLEEARQAEKETRKQQREAQRASQPPGEFGRDRTRGDWQQDEDSGGFAAGAGHARGERPFRPRPPREFDHGPRRAERGAHYPAPGREGNVRPGRRVEARDDRGPRRDPPFSGRPQRPAARARTFGGPRQFEDREGRFERRPSAPGYPERRERRAGSGPTARGGGYSSRPTREGGFRDRPPVRPGYGPKPYGAQAGAGRAGAKPGGYRGRPGGKPGYGRPYEERGERRSFDQGRSFDRGPRAGDARGGRLPARAGVFRSSSKPGLKAGFQSAGLGQRAERRPFRPAGGEGRPPGASGRGRAPAGRHGGEKFRGGNRSTRGFGHGPR